MRYDPFKFLQSFPLKGKYGCHSEDGPQTFALGALRRPLNRLTKVIVDSILDFAYGPVVDLRIAAEPIHDLLCRAKGVGLAEINATVGKAHACAASTVFQKMLDTGTKLLPAGLCFVTEKHSVFGNERGPHLEAGQLPESVLSGFCVSRVLTFDSYFRIENTFVSTDGSFSFEDDLGSVSYAQAFYWCTAHLKERIGHSLRFRARAWLVTTATDSGTGEIPNCPMHSPVSNLFWYLRHSSSLYFELLWVPGQSVEIQGLNMSALAAMLASPYPRISSGEAPDVEVESDDEEEEEDEDEGDEISQFDWQPLALLASGGMCKQVDLVVVKNLTVGQRVVIHGLLNTEMVGKSGSLLGFDSVLGTWNVLVDRPNVLECTTEADYRQKQMQVPPENLALRFIMERRVESGHPAAADTHTQQAHVVESCGSEKKGMDAPSGEARHPSSSYDHQESVIQLVYHDEPAAFVDQEVAALQGEIAWTESVQQQAQRPLEHDVANTGGQRTEGTAQTSIYMLRFGSAPCGGQSWSRFREQLLLGPQFAPCIDALRRAGFEVELPQGALIFTAPSQYSATRSALVGVELHPFNLIISEDLEYLLEEVLASLPFKRRPKLKQGERGRQIIDTSEPDLHSRASDEETEGSHGSLVSRQEADVLYDLCEMRTFLCFVPALKDAGMVTQSSTEVVTQSEAHYSHFRGVNPRRVNVT